MFTRSVCNCNTTIIFGEKDCIVTHYSLTQTNKEKDKDPSIYIPPLLEKFEYTQGAMIIGGDEKHFERIANTLQFYHIPIIAAYLDRWNDDMKWGEFVENGQKHKDVFVFPEEKQVYVWIQDENTYGETHKGCVLLK